MTFYVGLAVGLGVLAIIIDPGQSVSRNKLYSWLAFGTLGLFAAIRSPAVGADTQQYFNYYPVIAGLGWDEYDVVRYERGYFYLNKLFQLLTSNPQVFVGVTSFAVFVVLAWFFGTYSPNAAITALLFVFLQGYAMVLTALRQSIAMAVLLLFVPQLIKRHYLRFALGVALAAQFHTTAWVLLLLIPLVQMKMGFKTAGAYLMLSAALLGLNHDVLAFAVSSADQYTYYLGVYDNSSGKVGVVVVMLTYVAFLVFVTYYCSWREALVGADSFATEVFCHASWMLAPVMMLAYGSNTFLRLANYFLPFLVVVVPLALRRVPARFLRQVYTTASLLAALMYFIGITTLRPEWYRVTPYVTPFL